MRGLIVYACELAGIADLREFHCLPAWVQTEWLGHAKNTVEGAYSAPPRKERR